MKQISYTLILAMWLISCAENPDTPETPAPIEVAEYTIDQFMDNVSTYSRSFSHDESSILVGSNKSGIFNAYDINLESGEMTPITTSEDRTVWAASYLPNDNRLIFTADNDGDEIDHIYLRDLDGNETDLTPFEGAKASLFGWNKERTAFYYSNNARDPQYMDAYKMDIETFESEMIYQNDEGYNLSELTHDERYMVLSKAINSSDNDLFVLDTETGERTKINPNQSGNSPAHVSKDDQYLFYTTDDGSEFRRMMRYEFATGEITEDLSFDWGISYAYLSENGKYRVVGINDDGRTVVKMYDGMSGEELDFPDVDADDIQGVRFSRSETKMIITAGGSNSPSNLFYYNMESGEIKQLTNTLNPEIDPGHMVRAEVVRYKSFDGVEIPAIFYLPVNASDENPVPALVSVHGGPGGQSRASYNAFTQYLVNQGYAVLAVNNRGSSGYGKTFFQMDDQNHGEGDLQDCIEGKNFMASMPEIDGDRIGIIGGSYGGFMTMRAMTHTPEEFKVGVNLFGVTNWLRTLKSIPPWWESYKEALYTEMGDPNTADSVRLYDISPVYHGDKVVNPVMVLQGATDPRVLQAESDDMVAAIRANGVTCEYVLFDDEGHGFVKKENQIEGYGKIVEFLDQYLKGEAPEDGEIMESDEAMETDEATETDEASETDEAAEAH